MSIFRCSLVRRRQGYPRLLLALVILAALASLTATVPAQAATQDFGTPVSGQHIYDRAGVLSAAELADLEARAAAVDRAGAPVVVYLRPLDTTYDATEQDARDLMNAWDVQSAPDAHDGLVFFLNLKPNDLHHGQIALFSGEKHYQHGNLQKAELQRIYEQDMLPELKQGQLAAGIGAGLDAAAHSLTYGPPPPSRAQRVARALTAGPVSAVNLASLLLAGLGLFVAWSRYQTRPSRPIPVTPTTQAPGDLPPAVVGALVRGRIGNQQMEGTILDFARRGALAIEPAGRHHGIRIRLLDHSLVRGPYEEALWGVLSLGADSDGTLDSGALRGLQSHWDEARDALRAQLEEQGLYDPTAGARRRPAYLLGVVLVVLATVPAILAIIGKQPWGIAGTVLLALAGIVALILGGLIPNTTPAGESAAAPWRGYEAGIKAARGDRAAVLDLDEVVPYAAALGVVGSLDRRLKDASEKGYSPLWLGRDLAGQGQPAWSGGFYPYWATFHSAASPVSSGSSGGMGGGAASGGGGAGGGF